MPLFKGKRSKATPADGINYITRDDKAVLVSSQALDDSRSYAEQFKATGNLFGKGSGFNERKYYHFKLSCDPVDNITPELSHKLAQDLAAELFPSHECVLATHNDTDIIHSHIIVNSINFETGKKLRLWGDDYAACKDKANELGIKLGLTPLDWRQKTAEKIERKNEGISADNKPKTISQAERHMSKRQDHKTASWKSALCQAIDEAKDCCQDRAEFERYLKDTYNIEMPRNTTKTVSFKHPATGQEIAGKVRIKGAIRGAALGEYYTAASIDQALQINRERNLANGRLLATEERQQTKQGRNRERPVTRSINPDSAIKQPIATGRTKPKGGFEKTSNRTSPNQKTNKNATEKENRHNSKPKKEVKTTKKSFKDIMNDAKAKSKSQATSDLTKPVNRGFDR